jgi:hypothetical protein
VHNTLDACHSAQGKGLDVTDYPYSAQNSWMYLGIRCSLECWATIVEPSHLLHKRSLKIAHGPVAWAQRCQLRDVWHCVSTGLRAYTRVCRDEFNCCADPTRATQ